MVYMDMSMWNQLFKLFKSFVFTGLPLCIICVENNQIKLCVPNILTCSESMNVECLFLIWKYKPMFIMQINYSLERKS